MSLTASQFVSALTAQAPETVTTLSEHLADQEGELLLHLLVGDLQILALDCFRTGRTDTLSRLLSVLERGLRDGDEYVENAVAVSFVEDLGWWDPAMQPFIEVLPEGLLAEVERQQSRSD
ncbi:hypothetical protein [uncultured Nocardioides sp.]|uniref:DUF7674 family protein n=1 Tax=uncultured Nocardioides sp. TaxID=198441 RepID=UPI002611D613|nr:hypothetical protein [uncultured Nocardioides sp.]